jgi:hypothetical protein
MESKLFFFLEPEKKKELVIAIDIVEEPIRQARMNH